jgi:hypothetical protein
MRLAKQREERLWRAIETLAFRFVVRADGWKQFCRQLQIDPDISLRDLHGYEAVCHMEKVARPLACTPEEAIACLRDAVQSDKALETEAPPVRREYRVDTAEDVARSMRESLEEQFAAWR